MNDIFWLFQLHPNTMSLVGGGQFQVPSTNDHCSPKGAGECLKVTCQEYSLILIIIDSDKIKHYIKYRSLNSRFSVQSQERL